MIPNPEKLIEDFMKALKENHCISIDKKEIIHECKLSPHGFPDLILGKCAVYVFSLSKDSTALAGPNRALKVGKVGPNSGPRFKYQHYKSGSANSTLAGAVENNRVLWGYLGIKNKDTDFGNWLKVNSDRDHFYLEASQLKILSLLEVYVRGVLGPVFEGSLKNNG
jgi:hypothetical protein